jgi:hypothetical protein
MRKRLEAPKKIIPINIQIASILLCFVTLFTLAHNRPEFLFIWFLILIIWILIVSFYFKK